MRASTSYLSGAGTTHVGQMTVEESVDYTARLVLPKGVDEINRREKVHSVLKEVGLGSIIERKIGGGGSFGPITDEERVRVNLAQVLMEGKKILFLNEPTKTLDLLGLRKCVDRHCVTLNIVTPNIVTPNIVTPNIVTPNTVTPKNVDSQVCFCFFFYFCDLLFI